MLATGVSFPLRMRIIFLEVQLNIILIKQSNTQQIIQSVSQKRSTFEMKIMYAPHEHTQHARTAYMHKYT